MWYGSIHDRLRAGEARTVAEVQRGNARKAEYEVVDLGGIVAVRTGDGRPVADFYYGIDGQPARDKAIAAAREAKRVMENWAGD